VLLVELGPDRDLAAVAQPLPDDWVGWRLLRALRDLPDVGPTTASKLLARALHSSDRAGIGEQRLVLRVEAGLQVQAVDDERASASSAWSCVSRPGCRCRPSMTSSGGGVRPCMFGRVGEIASTARSSLGGRWEWSKTSGASATAPMVRARPIHCCSAR